MGELPLSTGPQKITCTSGSDISSTCVQECEPGYSLIGSTQRSCLLSGKWSGSEGTCKRTSCGAAKALQAMEDPYCTNTDKPGSTCYIRCPRGMSAFGTPYKQCHFNYQWFPAGPWGCAQTQMHLRQGLRRRALRRGVVLLFGSQAVQERRRLRRRPHLDARFYVRMRAWIHGDDLRERRLRARLRQQLEVQRRRHRLRHHVYARVPDRLRHHPTSSRTSTRRTSSVSRTSSSTTTAASAARSARRSTSAATAAKSSCTWASTGWSTPTGTTTGASVAAFVASVLIAIETKLSSSLLLLLLLLLLLSFFSYCYYMCV